VSRLAILSSGGGAVMAAAFDLITGQGRDAKWAVVTDRPCGTEQKAIERGLPLRRVEYRTQSEFSTIAAQWLFEEMRCTSSLLLFTRLVGPAFFQKAPCVNLHPSLLPLFPGFGALTATEVSGMRVMGATAHLVDESVDGGPILAQVWGPMPTGTKNIQRLSFAQKLYLALVIDEFSEREGGSLTKEKMRYNSAISAVAQPALSNGELEKAFRNFLKSEAIPWPA